MATTQAIHQVLAAAEQPEEAVAQLIELANQAGGPDNIACAVADIVDWAPRTHKRHPCGVALMR